MTGRLPDWPERLAAALEAARCRRFAWGRHDCALFAADLVLAQTGVDPAAGWRGAYRNARSARRLLRLRGRAEDGADLVALVDQHLPGEDVRRVAFTHNSLQQTRSGSPCNLGVAAGEFDLIWRFCFAT